MSTEIHTLPNGLRIVTDPMPGLASATVGIWVEAGGRHEQAEQNGIAHFLEHMAFKGTERRSAVEIAEAIEDVGGYINAYTSREMTAYYARVLKDDVALALDVLGDIVLNSIFDPDEIEVERGVILQEIGQALDTPDDIIFDWLQEVAYPGQAMGRTILGPAEQVRRFARADFARFIEDHYGPERLIIAAAGAIQPDEIRRLAEEQFGHLTPRQATAPEPAQFQTGLRREEKPLEQAHFTLAFEAPVVRDERLHANQIFATALGGGMSSRLFQEVREKRGLCYSIFAQAAAYSDTGLLTIYAGTSGEDVRALAEITVDEIRRAAGDMSEEELARARAQIRASMLMGLESSAARCERIARMLSTWGRVPTMEEAVAKLDAVTLADLRGEAERIANSGTAAMAVYGPVSGAPEVAELAARLAA
ncbi:MAG: pitrilysin family protein [Pseudomonadota bacterium]